MPARPSPLPLRLTRATTGLIAAALVLVGCGVVGGEDAAHRDGYEIAARIIDADLAAGGTPAAESGAGDGTTGDGPPPLELASADCTVEVTTDEYGFETETIVCPEGEQAAADETADGQPDALPVRSAVDLLEADGRLDTGYYPTLVATLPDADQAAAMTEIGATLTELEAACGVDQDRWVEALDRYLSAAYDATSVITADRLGDYQGSVEAKALARSLVERALMGSGCARPEPVPAADGDALLERTKRAAEVTVALDNSLRATAYGPLFHLYSSLPNYLWMRNERVDVDTVLLGTSQLGAAVDVARVNDRLSTEVGSAWIPGALAEVQTLWVEEVNRYTDPSTLVWFIGPLDLFAECDTSKRGVEFQRLADARASVFAQGFVPSADPIDRILGPATPDTSVRGDGIKREGHDEAGTTAHRNQYVPAFERNQFCHKRAEIVADVIQRMAAEGRSMVVVGMPVHPELRAVRPDTAAKMAMFERRYLDGAAFVDLTATVAEPGLWSDFTHLTAEGAGVFTDVLIDELTAVGVR